jgi:hypothetical protein
MRLSYLKLLGMVGLLTVFSALGVCGQTGSTAFEVVDKTIATVSDGVRTELITYSDLVWQLALQPDVRIDPPTGDDLNRALRLVIDQRLIALEARRLPSVSPTDAEVQAEIKRALAQFASTAAFAERLSRVGFESINDDTFLRIMRDRVAIEKYLDFRFRSFVVITPEEEQSYYKNVFRPRFIQSNPGVVAPELKDIRSLINRELTEQRIEADTDRFLDTARERAEIEILYEV